jgi:hypothetical protein
VITQLASARVSLDPPKELNRLLEKIGGENIYRQPRYRIVWGGTRLAHFYSRKDRWYEKRPKYFASLNRWCVEMWEPPSMGPSQWERLAYEEIDGVLVNCLGPYPSMGEYELLYPIATPHAEGCERPRPIKGGDGECECGGSKYLALTQEVIQKITDIVKLTREVTALERKHALLEREEKKEKDWDKMATDAIADAGRPFGGSYFVPVTGQSPDHWPKDKRLRFRVN